VAVLFRSEVDRIILFRMLTIGQSLSDLRSRLRLSDRGWHGGDFDVTCLLVMKINLKSCGNGES
jgi:hypothetical protein